MAKILAVQAALNCPSRPFTTSSHRLAQSKLAGTSGRRSVIASRAFKVEIETQRGVETITVEDGDTILQTALDQGIDLTHDCKMGINGEVDQSAGMLDDTAKEKGYALMCVAEPLSDCRIKVIDEDEILEEVLCSSENAG